MRFVFQYDFPDFNRLIKATKQHWSKYALIKKSATNYVAYLAQAQKKDQLLKCGNFPCSISFTYLLPNNKKDLDNISIAKKFICDGLVVAGIIPDDRIKYINGFTEKFLLRPDLKEMIVEVEI